jgi:hypothetical protein
MGPKVSLTQCLAGKGSKDKHSSLLGPTCKLEKIKCCENDIKS